MLGEVLKGGGIFLLDFDRNWQQCGYITVCVKDEVVDEECVCVFSGALMGWYTVLGNLVQMFAREKSEMRQTQASFLRGAEFMRIWNI